MTPGSYVQEVRESAEAIREALERAEWQRAIGDRHFDDAIAALDSLLAYIKQLEEERDEERRLRLISVKPSYEALIHRAEAAEQEIERLREALELTYKSIDNLCARPGTCMAVRPRLAARTEAEA